MGWWKGDDKSHENDKLLAVGLAGTGLHFRATSWCAAHETDGRLPASVVPSLSPTFTPSARRKLVTLMCAALTPGRDPLWVPEVDAEGTVVAYWLNGYLKRNPSREELRERRLLQHAGNVAGGRKRSTLATRDERGHFRRSQPAQPAPHPGR